MPTSSIFFLRLHALLNLICRCPDVAINLFLILVQGEKVDTEWNLWLHYEEVSILQREVSCLAELHTPQPQPQWLLHQDTQGAGKPWWVIDDFNAHQIALRTPSTLIIICSYHFVDYIQYRDNAGDGRLLFPADSIWVVATKNIFTVKDTKQEPSSLSDMKNKYLSFEIEEELLAFLWCSRDTENMQAGWL